MISYDIRVVLPVKSVDKERLFLTSSNDLLNSFEEIRRKRRMVLPFLKFKPNWSLKTIAQTKRPTLPPADNNHLEESRMVISYVLIAPKIGKEIALVFRNDFEKLLNFIS